MSEKVVNVLEYLKDNFPDEDSWEYLHGEEFQEVLLDLIKSYSASALDFKGISQLIDVYVMSKINQTLNNSGIQDPFGTMQKLKLIHSYDIKEIKFTEILSKIEDPTLKKYLSSETEITKMPENLKNQLLHFVSKEINSLLSNIFKGPNRASNLEKLLNHKMKIHFVISNDIYIPLISKLINDLYYQKSIVTTVNGNYQFSVNYFSWEMFYKKHFNTPSKARAFFKKGEIVLISPTTTETAIPISDMKIAFNSDEKIPGSDEYRKIYMSKLQEINFALGVIKDVTENELVIKYSYRVSGHQKEFETKFNFNDIPESKLIVKGVHSSDIIHPPYTLSTIMFTSPELLSYVDPKTLDWTYRKNETYKTFQELYEMEQRLSKVDIDFNFS